ncbi:hypothetical protein ACFW6U_18270 [Pseudomonas guariconensis]|uniref:hypothetical protein n=1 Tax=Pseudomonas guariconensis TaxID=1288410 RepID=UPI00209A82F8|nr:hypothetical protein [Pseudomonas guariconensis]MCO7623249.1 hypothetical protein [Pseudomonas guariconensis]
MTKAIPDPPHRSTTAPAAFDSCEHSHPPLFSVCAGVELEDALVHLSSLLKGACASNLKALQITDGTCHDLLLGNDHALEAGKALVEALLDGLERQQVTKTID